MLKEKEKNLVLIFGISILHLREGLRSAVSLHATVVTHPTLSIVVTSTFVSIEYNI